MSAAEKVALVEGARSEFGLSACLRILELARSTWYCQARRQPYGEKYGACDLVELETVVTERVVYYNSERRHSALGNQAPMAYVRGLRTPRG